MIEPLTIILLALVGLCLVVMWGNLRRLRLRMDYLQDQYIEDIKTEIKLLRDALNL